ncbi:DUF7537 family lipoprotein [Halostella pelagica]|uniref:DUF7537 family lipoprotein n=1 Tax=Halostella pelagica TaxID=2583824 RepID=UPI001080C737|nr:hypothetical protein [Halostella pelagica]
MERSWAIVFVVALVALAGCGGIFGDGPWPDDASAHPPGVSPSGLEDASSLSSAHNESLVDESYELTVNQEVTFIRDNRNVTTGSARVVTMADDGEFLVEARTHGSETVNETIWANGSTAYVRTEQDDEVQYDRRDASRFRSQLSGYSLLYEYLAAGEFDVTSVDRRDGRTFVTLQANEFSGGGIGTNFQTVQTYEARAVVDERGQIHELTVHIEGSQSGTPVVVDITLQLDTDGSADVSRPDWVDEARERNH